jgi:hypothetical protein
MSIPKKIHPFDKLCNKNIDIVSTRDQRVCIIPDGTGYNCILSYNGRSINTPFSLGSGYNGRKPTAGEVVYCIMSDGRSAYDTDFESWCDDLGYSSDSIAHKKLYDKCIEIESDVRYLLGDDYDKFQEASEDY